MINNITSDIFYTGHKFKNNLNYITYTEGHFKIKSSINTGKARFRTSYH